MPSRPSCGVLAGCARRRTALAVLVVLGAALASTAGCGPTEPPNEEETATGGEAFEREAFVEVYVALLRARANASDSTTAAEARQAVLERHGVTADVLDAYIDRHSDDVEHLAELWERIRERLAAVADSLTVAADSADADPGVDAPADAFDDEPLPGRSAPPEMPAPPWRGPPNS